MGLIQCAEDCVYQLDGYCGLDTVSGVNSIDKRCPHFLSRSADAANGVLHRPDADNLDAGSD